MEEVLLVSPHEAAPCSRDAFTTLERQLVIESDAADVLQYLRTAYKRLRQPLEDDAIPRDQGGIYTRRATWLTFNGEPIEYHDDDVNTTFRRAFYGASKLFRLSFQRNPDWHSMYGAALKLGDRAIIISAQSGIGKTTLALELMARGAGFYSDEFVFVRKRDKAVSGLPRALMIRQRTLSVFHDARLKAVCEQSAPRIPHGDRVWDTIDVGEVFGDAVFAQPAPLAAAVMLERGSDSKTQVERVPAALAAADFTKRFNAEVTGFERFVAVARVLDGTPCYRVKANSPQAAAAAIEAVL